MANQNLNLTDIASRISRTLKLTGYPEVSELMQLKDDLDLLLTTLNKPSPSISNVTSDFPALLVQLQEHIRKEGTWKDFHMSSTGQTLLEVIAAIGAFLQNSVHVSFRESFTDTAVRDSSRYEIANMLGVRIARKNSAKVKTWLRRSDSSTRLTVPPYEQFSVDGLAYFNPFPIVFPEGESSLPFNLEFDEFGNAKPNDSTALTNLYTGQLSFNNEGQVYFPCTGVVTANYDGQLIEGTIELVSDSSNTGSAFGTINIVSTAIIPASTKFKVVLTQYDKSLVEAELTFTASTAYLRCPTALSCQVKRTGVGSSFLTPTAGTVSVNSKAIIVSDEPLKTIRTKYLLPQYLDKSILIYENRLELYSGRVVVAEHVVANSNPFYSIKLGQAGFNVANDHIYVEVFNGQTYDEWTLADKPLYEYGANDKVFADSTLGNGDAKLTFGDGVHGMRLEAGWTIGIRYVLTVGAAANNSEVGAKVTNSRFNLVGATLTPSYGGADERSSHYYAQVSPNLIVAKDRVATAEDVEATVLTYPGVADAVLLSQKDIAPNDIRYMNKAAVVVLPESPSLTVNPIDSVNAGQVFDPSVTNPKDPNDANRFYFNDLELTDFKAKFSKRAQALVDYDFHLKPIPIPVYVEVKVWAKREASLATVQSNVNIAIKSLFLRTRGILGRSLFIADLVAISSKVTGVDYVEIVSPTVDTVLSASVPDRYSFLTLSQSPTIHIEYSDRRIQ